MDAASNLSERINLSSRERLSPSTKSSVDRMKCNNRNLKISRALLKSTRAPASLRALRRIQEGFSKGVKRSSGPISRIPGGDRVAVKAGVVQMGRVNDQMGQGKSD